MTEPEASLEQRVLEIVQQPGFKPVKPRAIARRGRDRKRPVLVGRRERGAPARVVVRKAAAREHDATCCVHFDVAFRRCEHGTAHASIREHQPRRAGIRSKVHASVGCGSQQPGCECQAVAQLHRAAVDGEIGEVLRHSPGHVGERARRARDVHERAKVGTCLDREAQERRLAQRQQQISWQHLPLFPRSQYVGLHGLQTAL